VADLSALMSLLGTEDVSPEERAAFQTASPLTYGAIQGRYFSPYQERLGMGYAQPVGSLQDEISLRNYISEVQKQLMEKYGAK